MALVVITGGARSGKSRAAQMLAESRIAEGQRVVVAVFASETDPEMAERIANHRSDRSSAFAVIEAEGSTSWLPSVPTDAVLVVDCLGTCLGLAMLEAWRESARPGAELGQAADLPEGLLARFQARSRTLVDALAARTGDTIVVTNEVGSGVVPPYATGRAFQDELGRANSALVGVAQAAYLAVAGRLIDLAELPRTITWPED